MITWAICLNFCSLMILILPNLLPTDCYLKIYFECVTKSMAVVFSPNSDQIFLRRAVETSPNSDQRRVQIGKQGGDKGRKRKLNWKDRKKNKREEQQKEEDQQIAKGFNSAIPSTNIGFKMLQQMGYNPGVALGKHGQGRLEPVSLEIKRSRAGLGRDHVEKEEKERRAQEMEKIIQNKKRKEGNLMSEYGERQKILWQTRKIVVNYKKASAALAQLEEANSKPDSDIEKEKGLKEETEETEDNEEEEEVTAEDLQAVLDRLRTEFHYCLYCGCQYESADAMLSHCPGVEEEDH